MSKTVLFQTIQFSISTQFLFQKTVPFQAILLNMSALFSSILPIDWTISSATTLSQSGPGSYGSKGVLHIPQSSSITGTSSSGFLVSYPRCSLEWGLLPLQRSSRCILQSQLTEQLRSLVGFFSIGISGDSQFFLPTKKRKFITRPEVRSSLNNFPLQYRVYTIFAFHYPDMFRQ